MDVVERLRAAGCVFAEEEARLLGDRDDLVARRVSGERLEHVLGRVDFAGVRLDVDPGVFVPRPQTASLAFAAALFEPRVALDLFCGTAAIACVVKARVPGARVVAGELDPAALACARRNGARFGVEVVESDVDGGVPPALAGTVDVLTANVPYVPTSALPVVPHEGEPAGALDGGDDGLEWTRRVVACAPRWLRPGGWLLTEIGGEQAEPAGALLSSAGFDDVDVDDQVLLGRFAG